MAAWRMAMRGRYRPSDGSWLEPARAMWPHCRDLGVAAITYDSIQNDDFARYTQQNPPGGWAQLASSRKANLRRFVYEMRVGDVLYVKEGLEIVGKGIILSDYRFDLVGPIPGDLGTQWRHQRQVRWNRGFQAIRIQLGRTQRATIELLTEKGVARVEAMQLR